MAMEFWAVEVKQGQSLKVAPEEDKIIHISQASLGECKDEKSANNVPLRMKIDGKDYVMGFLNAAERPQLIFDLVIEKDFELSHGWKNGSVFFFGYQTPDPCLEDMEDSEVDYTDSDEEIPIDAPENGKLEPKDEKKTTTLVPLPSKKPAAKQAEPKKEEPESDEDDESGSEDFDAEDSDDSMEDGEGSDEDDSEDDSEEEVPVPVKPAEPLKKRPAAAVPESNPNKKAKKATPEKPAGPAGKKAAPPPKQQGGKSPQSFNNSNKKGQKKFNNKKH